jgi:hypothetical protein
MEAEHAQARKTTNLPWFLPFLFFIPLLVAAPLWHSSQAPAVQTTGPPVSHPPVSQSSARSMGQQPRVPHLHVRKNSTRLSGKNMGLDPKRKYDRLRR